jgi:GDPmannose 4,6-dehydratase
VRRTDFSYSNTGIRFVTKRIASGAARYKLGIADAKHPLTLAGIDMARDFGHAEDYVRGMWLMLQQDEPRDLVLATGVKTTVREFVEMAFARVGVVIRSVSPKLPNGYFYS